MRRFLMLIVLSLGLVGSGVPLFAESTTTAKGPVAEAGAAEKPAPKVHKKHGGKKHRKEKTSKAGGTSVPTASAEKAAK